MSTDTTDTERDDREQRAPTQEEYEAATADHRWVPLEHTDGAFKVQEVAPLKLLRDMERYGVAALLRTDESDIDMADLVSSGDFGAFVENLLLPNILEPNCYWDDMGQGDFDIAALEPDDLMAVIVGMTGQDQEELEEEMDNRFRG